MGRYLYSRTSRVLCMLVKDRKTYAEASSACIQSNIGRIILREGRLAQCFLSMTVDLQILVGYKLSALLVYIGYF